MRALLCAALLAAFGCGGTSSETPWPVEPDEDTPGPGADTRSPAPAQVAPVDPTATGAPVDPRATGAPVDAPDGGAAEQKSPEPKKAPKPEP